MRAAWELTAAAKAAVGNSMALADFWFGAGAKALAPLLLAAAASGATIADVARWVDREERDEPLRVLRRLEPDAVLAHQATFRREDRGRSSLIQVMQAAVGAYLDPVVGASAARADIAAAGLLDGGAHTLYLSAPPDEQERFRALFTALLGQVISAAYRHTGATGQPLDPPLLLVLDEAANIAPVGSLPTVASTAASLGVQLVTVFQDLAQIRHRYGDTAGTVVNNHRAKVLLPALLPLRPVGTRAGPADPARVRPRALAPPHRAPRRRPPPPGEDTFIRRRLEQQTADAVTVTPSPGVFVILEATPYRVAAVLAVDRHGHVTPVTDPDGPADPDADYHFSFRPLAGPQPVIAPLDAVHFAAGCPPGHDVHPTLARVADSLDRAGLGADMVRFTEPASGHEEWIGRQTLFDPWEAWDDPRRYYPGDPAEVLDNLADPTVLSPAQPADGVNLDDAMPDIQGVDL